MIKILGEDIMNRIAWDTKLFSQGKKLIIEGSIEDGIRLLKRSNNLYHLAQLYIDGNLIPQDYEKAFKIINSLIKKECHHSKILLSEFYKNGFHVKKDLDKAFNILNKLDEDLCFEARKHIAEFYEKGALVEQDYAKAYKYYDYHYLIPEIKCLKGLERLYRNGLGVERDINLADFYAEKIILLSKINSLIYDVDFKGLSVDNDLYQSLNKQFAEGFENIARFKD